MREINEDTPGTKWTRKALLESEKRYRRLLDNAPDIIFRMSLPDGKFDYISPAAVQLTGYTPEDYYSHPCLPEKLLHPDWEKWFKKEWKAMLKGDIPRFYEYQIIDRAGKTRWFHQNNVMVKDEYGHPEAIEGIIADITDRKQTEDALRESEEKYRSLTEQVHDGIYIYQGGHFLFTNTHISDMSGYSKDELLAIPFIDLVHPDDRAYIRDLSERRLRGEPVPDRYGCRFIRKDGAVRDVEAVVSVIHYKGGYATLGAAWDITDRKKAEAALVESEAKLQMALSGSETGMWELDIPTMAGIIDDRASKILGYHKNDIGTHTTDWDILSHPEDIPGIQKRLTACLEGHTTFFESEHRMRHTSGEWIWVASKGKITQWLRDGSPLRISGTMHDITKRKRAEDVLSREW